MAEVGQQARLREDFEGSEQKNPRKIESRGGPVEEVPQALRGPSHRPARLGLAIRTLAPTPEPPMPEETIDPALLEKTKNDIRKLVAEIADLAEFDIQPAEFYVEFSTAPLRRWRASGMRFVLDGRGSLKLQHQLEFRLTGLMDGRAKTAPHDALLGCMIQASQPQIIPPGATIEGVPNAGNSTVSR